MSGNQPPNGPPNFGQQWNQGGMGPGPQQPYPQQPNPQPHYVPRPPNQKKFPTWLKVVMGLVLVVLVFRGCGGSGESSTTTPVSTSTTSRSTTTQAPTSEAASPPPTTQAPAQVEEPPMEVTSRKMIDDLEGNALKASNTYKGKRVTVTGYVGNIDSGGKYFSVDPETNAFILAGVTADVRSEEHRAALAELSKNDKVTVTGKVTLVGEILGYRIDVDSMS